MSDAREQVLVAVRDWIKEVLKWTDEDLMSRLVLEDRGYNKGPTLPDPPYIAYNVTMFGLPLGMEEYPQRPGGHTVTGGRSGTLGVIGYGAGSEEWLERLGMLTVLSTDPLTIENLSPIIDISEFDENSIEARFARDFALMYRATLKDDDEDGPPIPTTWALKVLHNGEEFTP